MGDNDPEIEPHPDFVTGFNMGYTLARHEPELALQIERQIENSNSERSSGFKSGMAQYAMEKDKNLQAEWIKDSEMDHIELGRDNQLDKDDIELEL